MSDLDRNRASTASLTAATSTTRKRKRDKHYTEKLMAARLNTKTASDQKVTDENRALKRRNKRQKKKEAKSRARDGRQRESILPASEGPNYEEEGKACHDSAAAEERQKPRTARILEKFSKRKEQKKRMLEFTHIRSAEEHNSPHRGRHAEVGMPFLLTESVSKLRGRETAADADSLSPQLTTQHFSPPSLRPTLCQTPAHIYNLTSTPQRLPSPQPDVTTTTRLPPHFASPISLLALLKTRSTRLQSQISGFETKLRRSRDSLRRLLPNTASDRRSEVMRRIAGLEEIVGLVTEHLHEILVLEYALRDMLDETETAWDMGGEEKMRRELSSMVAAYDDLLVGLMGKVSLDAVRRCIEEVGAGEGLKD